MNVDTGQWRAITAENDELRSEVGALMNVAARLAADVVASGTRLVPALTVVAGRGRGRHARRRSGHLRVIQGGRR